MDEDDAAESLRRWENWEAFRSEADSGGRTWLQYGHVGREMVSIGVSVPSLSLRYGNKSLRVGSEGPACELEGGIGCGWTESA